MNKDKAPLLSKSRFTAGLQCVKLLYLGYYHPELADKISPAQQAVFDTGTGVGQLARKLYPGGRLVAADFFHFEKAIDLTLAALSDTYIPAIFEGAFIFDKIRIRADILVRVGEDVFDLVEFKSGTQVKEENIPDAAIQAHVLSGAGIRLRHVSIGHLNRDYIYEGGEYDLKKLFTVEDVTDLVIKYQSSIPETLKTFREVLSLTEPPPVDVSRQCHNPYDCNYIGYCHKNLPEHHILELPRVSETMLRALRESGIETIPQIPPDFPGLNATQQLVRECVINKNCHLDPALTAELNKLTFPVHFLDFETFSPVLPVFPGTRPYQVIPFQWSDHILEANGKLRHAEYLHEGTDDPRRNFAETMLKALGDSGSILVYSSYELSRIRELAEVFPDLADKLLALEDRLVDLLQLIRKYCYHPEFHGSFSIKHVLPAMVPGLDWSDLEIQEGNSASLAYTEILKPETPSDRRAFLRQSLLKYCFRDTEAEVRLFEVLKSRFF